MKNIILPPSGNGDNIKFEDIHSMVIVGANGTGKSRLGYWIETNQPEGTFVHRLSGQRSLDFSNTVFQDNIVDAERNLFFGTSSENVLKRNKKNPKIKRWSNGPITGLLWDIDDLLTLLFAHENKRNREFVNLAKKSKNKSLSEQDLKKSHLDVLQEIWHKLLPHRNLDIKDYSISVIGSGNIQYEASQMSDGEKNLLYLIGQILCVPSDAIIIIDEPELHIHRSVHSKLWNELEKIRNDCLFIYITHDLDFSSSRTMASKICLESFDGDYWNWQEIPKDKEIPENILLEVLGSRDSVIFVEGDSDSFDFELYSYVYPNMTIIPVNSCSNVIDFTRVMNSVKKFHYIKTYGMIDRDYRTEDEIDRMGKNSIYTLPLAEIENIFLLENILKCTLKQLCSPNPEEIITEIKHFVIKEFEKMIKEHAEKVVISKFRNIIGTFNGNYKSFDRIQNSIKDLSKIDFHSLRDKSIKDARILIDTNDYENIIKVFNHKGLIRQIGRFLGLKMYYSDMVRRMLRAGNKDLVKEMQKILPVIDS